MRRIEMHRGFRQAIATTDTPAAVLAIRALSQPRSMADVMAVLGQRGLVPGYFTSRVAEPYLLIEIELSGANGHLRDALLERLRTIACVDRAEFMSERKA